MIFSDRFVDNYFSSNDSRKKDLNPKFIILNDKKKTKQINKQAKEKNKNKTN